MALVKSVGIDIGTTTTQVIFSELTLNALRGAGRIPSVSISERKVIYKSPIYFTPLKNRDFIDAEAVSQLVQNEYLSAGFKKEDIQTGAVIITGESSRKANASHVALTLSEAMGDFIVATAGPALESVLSGKGAGADHYSKDSGYVIANLDIGGGTTNISVFKEGEILSTACYDIGGRLIRIAEGKVEYISEKLLAFLRSHHVNIDIGDAVSVECMQTISKLLVELLEDIIRLDASSKWAQHFITDQPLSILPDRITFSGGVSECIWQSIETDAFGDIGVFLGKAISESDLLMAKAYPIREEGIRATVIGVGNYSMTISGSTIESQKIDLPLKNIPVMCTDHEMFNNVAYIREKIDTFMEMYSVERAFAIYLESEVSTSFVAIQNMVNKLNEALRDITAINMPFIVIFKTDIAKVVGQTIKRMFPTNCSFLCIDGITCHHGDYIDVGEYIDQGVAVPVVIKTLAFKK